MSPSSIPVQLELGSITVDVVLKDIKHIHLSVYPPTGRVRISAPQRMNLDNIRVFALSKLGWIQQQQRKLLVQSRETPREYLDLESYYLWGKRYLLRVIEAEVPSRVEVSHNKLHLWVRPDSSLEKKQALLEAWYRQQLRDATPTLITKWEPLMGVRVKRVLVQKMKTRWGSCNPSAASIRLNTDLAKKPVECLEYIVVHEMTHLLEPTHNRRFVSLMNGFLPHWQQHRDALNALPLSFEHWTY